MADVDGFGRGNPFAMIRKLVDDEAYIVTNAGAPTDGTSGTYAAFAGPGTLLLDITNGKLYQNTNTKASPTWGSVGDIASADIDAGAVTELKLSTALQGAAEGLGNLRVARATYDFAVDGGAISAIDSGVTIPDNAVIVGGFVDVVTTLTSATDAATMAISTEGADDIVAAVAISTGTPWDAGLHAIVPKANTPESTGIKMTAANAVTFTIAVEAVTAGKFECYLNYVISS